MAGGQTVAGGDRLTTQVAAGEVAEVEGCRRSRDGARLDVRLEYVVDQGVDVEVVEAEEVGEALDHLVGADVRKGKAGYRGGVGEIGVEFNGGILMRAASGGGRFVAHGERTIGRGNADLQLVVGDGGRAVGAQPRIYGGGDSGDRARGAAQQGAHGRGFDLIAVLVEQH